MRQRPIIWLIEDSLADITLVRESLEVHGVNCELAVARDGNEAKQLIDGLCTPDDCPDLILLDINLPIANGHEILAHLRRHRLCQDVPVIVTSSSDAPRDKALTAERGIAHYFRKPSSLKQYLGLGNLVKSTLSAGAQ